MATTLPRAAALPGGFDPARFLAGRGLLWEGRFDGQPQLLTGSDLPLGPDWLGRIAGSFLCPVRGALLDRLAGGLPPREAALVASVLLGERDLSSRAAREPFARLGLAHLFAVSGLHVGILLVILAAMLRPFSPGPWLRLVVVLAVLSVYALLTGMSSSVLRAAGMVLLVLSGPVWGRKCDPLNGLGLLFWLNYQLSPCSILDSGLRLSYLAATGIVLVSRLIGPVLRSGPRVVRWVLAAGSVTLSAQWFTACEVACSFGWYNPLSPLLNLVAVPVFSVAVWCAVIGIGVGLLWSWGAEAVLGVSWLLFRLLTAGAGMLDRELPLVVGVPVLDPGRLAGFLLLSAGLLEQVRRLGRGRRGPGVILPGLLLAGGLVCLLSGGGRTGGGRMAAVQFDVGQGDCGLLRFPDGWTALVDTGPAWPGGSALQWSVLPWLERQRIRKLDAVILTHGHHDHTGGAEELVRRCQVCCWYLGGSAAEKAEVLPPGSVTRSPVRGDLLHENGPWQLVCLYPDQAGGAAGSAENDRSIVLALLREGEAVALWSGDLERAGERSVLAGPVPAVGTGLQVWKGGHHGSNTSGTANFLAWARPRLVVISCGVENRHHHPSHGPYLAAGDTVPLIRTDLAGSIFWQWENDGELHWWTAVGERGRLPRDLEPAPAATASP